MSFSSAIRWVAALHERGSYAPLPMGGDTRSQRVEAHADFLLGLHRRKVDLWLNEICDRLSRARGEKCRHRYLAIFRPPRHHIQKKSAHASEQDRPDVLERRRRWFDGQLDLDPLKLVFVDETAATTNMARRYGRRRRGQRLRCGVPHGHYKAITFVFGLRLRGVVAPNAYDHAMNAECEFRRNPARDSDLMSATVPI